MFDFLNNKIINFHGSLLGFENLNRFLISMIEENSPYAYLQSMDDENIGFLVASPFSFFPDYAVEIEENDNSLLEIVTHEEAALLGMITIHDPFINSTMNLLAPLIINITNGKARQIVLPPKSTYSTKERLFQVKESEVGE